MDFDTYTTLTFDCYGTLIDWETGIVNALRPWLAREGKGLTDNQILEAFGRAENAEEKANPDKLYPDLLGSVLQEMAQGWGLSATADDALVFGRSVADWPAFPDSADALAYLAQHYKLGIISNVDRDSFAHSNRRLSVTFDMIVTAQDVGSYKPNLQNFHYAFDKLAHMGVDQTEILHVAQSLHHDMEPAQTLGLPTVWVNRRHNKAGMGATAPPRGDTNPNLTVNSMAQLVELHRSTKR